MGLTMSRTARWTAPSLRPSLPTSGCQGISFTARGAAHPEQQLLVSVDHRLLVEGGFGLGAPAPTHREADVRVFELRQTFHQCAGIAGREQQSIAPRLDQLRGS